MLSKTPLMRKQKSMINYLKSVGEQKYLCDRVLILFDDLVGSEMFRGNKGNYFTRVATRHRHHGASFMFVSQAYKEIPATIRCILMCMCVFRIGNEVELRKIYEEFGMGLKWKDWLEVYNAAINNDQYGFMFLNYQKPPDMRIMRKFDQFLTLDSAEGNDVTTVDEEDEEDDQPKKKKRKKKE